MKINVPIEIPEDGKARLLAVQEHKTDVFSDIVIAAGMLKNHDFIGADLAEVDFTGSDLRGFNFKNADLSNSYGVNFIIDDTTILDGANVKSSVFRYEKDRREFLLNDEHRALFNRLKKEYWTNGAVWIGQNLKPSSKNYAVSSKIAKYLYSSVTDQTYKNQILYGIKNTFENKDEYKGFLIDQLRDSKLSTRTLRGIIDILSRLFSRDADVVKILLFFLGHEDHEVRRLCIPAVMQHGFFSRNRAAILNNVEEETVPELRRIYTGCFSKLVSKDASRLMYDNGLKQFHDFAQIIDDRLFERMVRGAIYFDKVDQKVESSTFREMSAATTVTYEDVRNNAGRFNKAVLSLVSTGLPLKTAYRIGHFGERAPMGEASISS